MAVDSWPNGVTSWEDTVKFAELVFGKDIAVENYSHRLPHSTEQSFLLFAKGACAEGRKLHDIANLIEPHMAEIQAEEIRLRNNHARPSKSQMMLGSDNQTVHYWSSQLTRAPCTCRSFFGADKHMKHVPTCSSNWNAGERFAKLWDATLLKNFATFDNRNLRPIWLDKSWQAVWNWNDRNQGHGIALHADACDTYSSLDPITSFSFGRGGVLTLLSFKSQQASKMLFQENGDAFVMSGKFQSEFWHGVPERSSWSGLKLRPMFNEMQDWEKRGFDFEVESHEAARSSDQHVRMNCTIRWHTTHWEKCPNHVHWTQPVLTGAVRTLDDRADEQVASVSMVATSATSAYGTQPVFTGAVQGAAEANGARDTVFVGMKRLSSEADMCPSVSSIKSTRSLDTASAEAVRTLLEVVKQAPRMNLFRMLLLSLPLVGCAHAHGQRLMEMEDSVRRWRAQLLQASEAVEEFGEKFLEKVDYMPLNILELAARQRRIIQQHLGSFHTQKHGDWLIETPIKPLQNRLNKAGRYHKCLVTHQQLELALQALSASEMEKHKEIALDLGELPYGSFPTTLTSAKRHDKRKQNDDLGFDTYKVPAGSVLLVKALEIGYVRQLQEGKRLQAQQSAWESLLEEVPVCDIKFSLETGLRTTLEHLRTLDVERELTDRQDGNMVSAKYDIWIWLWHVQEQVVE